MSRQVSASVTSTAGSMPLRSWPVPAGRFGHRPQRLDAAPQPDRHHLHDLRQHADGDLRDALHRVLGGGLQAHGQRDGLLVVDDQRRERRARGELVAAVDAALRLDRVAQLAQPVDVPAQGADGHAQPLGEFAARPVPVGLEQGQQPQRPGARVRHVLQCRAFRQKVTAMATSVGSTTEQTERSPIITGHRHRSSGSERRKAQIMSDSTWTTRRHTRPRPGHRR